MSQDLDPTDRLPSRAAMARELLRYKMLEYSEDFFCAAWLVDLEFELWEAAERLAPSERDMFTVTTSRECRRLAELAGGWWVYEGATRPGERGPLFVSTARWLEIRTQRDQQNTP